MEEYTVLKVYLRSYVKNMDISNYEVILTDNAKEDLEKIYDYISNHMKNISSVYEMMEQLEQKILRLEQFPYSCPEVKIKPKNLVYRKLLVNGKYVALYKIDEQYKKVNIIHIYYTKQDYLA